MTLGGFKRASSTFKQVNTVQGKQEHWEELQRFVAAAARKLETSSLKGCCKDTIKDWSQEQVLNKTPTLKICVKKLDFWWFFTGWRDRVVTDRERGEKGADGKQGIERSVCTVQRQKQCYVMQYFVITMLCALCRESRECTVLRTHIEQVVSGAGVD